MVYSPLLILYATHEATNAASRLADTVARVLTVLGFARNSKQHGAVLNRVCHPEKR